MRGPRHTWNTQTACPTSDGGAGWPFWHAAPADLWQAYPASSTRYTAAPAAFHQATKKAQTGQPHTQEETDSALDRVLALSLIAQVYYNEAH